VDSENSQSVTIQNSNINGNVKLEDDGSVTITNNVIDGDLEIKGTTGSCTESDNTVDGNNSGCS